ncbi:MAG: glutamyl-Q tRNA(Asp) synthetase [Acidobacteriota bacterium]
MSYTGRFAPSPTGPLHLGSLVTAVGSYLEARSRGGRWLVRMEDLDGPRCVPGADAEILRALEAYGFAWDGPVLYQSTRTAAYAEAVRELGDLVYPCGCSRREVCGCARGLPAGRVGRSLKVRGGDFVIRRADGFYAYQLAVVVDDAYQGVTDVVRGEDLLDSTPGQIYLHRALGLTPPRYRHIRLVRDARGDKLSKQTLAPALPLTAPAPVLRQAMQFLGLEAPEAPVGELWDWAMQAAKIGL